MTDITTPTPIVTGNFASMLNDMCSTMYIDLVTTLKATPNLQP